MSKARIEDDIWTFDENAISKIFEKKEDIPALKSAKGEVSERVIKEISENVKEPELAEESEHKEQTSSFLDQLNKMFDDPPEIKEEPEKSVPVILLQGRNENIIIDHYPFIIGRHDADYEINSTFVSSNHCEFTEEDGEIYIEDLDSTNGTYIGNDEIKGKAKLRNGQSLFIADRRYLILWQL